MTTTRSRPAPRRKPGKDQQQERIYIRAAAEALNRRMSTLRKWEQLGVLPRHLRAQRGPRGWRYWTPDQIEGIRKWLKETKRIPGNALPHYNPTEKQVDQALAKMRRPRRCALCEEPIKRGQHYTRRHGKAIHVRCLSDDS